MQTRPLGSTSLDVPVVTFGAWAIGGWGWGGSDDTAAVRALHAAFEAGTTAVDTAPIYGFGHSERIVGRALREWGARRDEVRVLTKVGLCWDGDAGELSFETTGPDGRRVQVRRNARPESVRAELDASLERLGLERVDLLQVHWPDSTTPIADTMGALAELRAAGRTREVGVSNYSVAQLEEARRALGDVPLASDQPRYSLLARDVERDVLPWCREHGVGTLVYSPLEQGLLTGKVGPERTFPPGDGRAQRATFRPHNRAAVNAALEAAVQPVARAHGATLAQVVLAWTLAQPGVTSVLVGARRPEQAVENAGAADVRLSADELGALRGAFEALRLDARPPGRLRRLARRLLGR